jgi:hypothetical protein
MVQEYNIMNTLYYCIIGIEMGMTCASKIDVIATFSSLDKAKNFLKEKTYSSNYSIVEIVETLVDVENMDLRNVEIQNSIHLN